jgi:uncharacterized phage protein (TIGR01671 family)
MSREIKFRAWDKTNKCWLLGYEYPNLGGFSIVGECVLMGEFEALFHPLTRINEIEIMQFTGLLDKQGKEVYEGDIVHHLKYGGNYQVSYSQENTGYDLENPSRKLAPMHLCSRCQENIEVIGNIHETPELLK